MGSSVGPRNLKENEISELCSILDILSNTKLFEDREDRRLWVPCGGNGFSCKSFFFSLSSNNLTSSHLHKFIWKTPRPKKIQFSAWLLVHGRVSTCDVIQKRLPNVFLSPNWYSLCKSNSESLNHIFLHCKFAWVLPQSQRIVDCLSLNIEHLFGKK